MFIALQLYTTQ